MTELDKLEAYLIAKKIPYERYDEAGKPVMNRHQIVVFEDVEHIIRSWDAICQYGSYGFEEGLLEVMGEPVVRESDGDDVCGYLTADDVIARLKE